MHPMPPHACMRRPKPAHSPVALLLLLIAPGIIAPPLDGVAEDAVCLGYLEELASAIWVLRPHRQESHQRRRSSKRHCHCRRPDVARLETSLTLSGWNWIASFLYALLMSSSDAPRRTPSTLYASGAPRTKGDSRNRCAIHAKRITTPISPIIAA